MGRTRTSTCLALLACVVCGLVAAPSQASFHLTSVREVFPGTVANPNADYVVLQMYAPGQNLVHSRELEVYDASAMFVTGPNFGAATDVPNGDNQRTILIATTQAQAAFGITADLNMNPGINPAGGAVCWDNTIDCVSWGSFSGSLGSSTGTPASGIPDGSALRRSIAPGCSTLLEPGDDTNNSAADFQPVAPNPRNNASPITETPCGVTDSDAPNTKIKKRPKNRSDDTSPTFKFKSDESGSTFKCKLDHKPFRKCKPPKTYHGLDPGKHTFKVEAIDAFGNLDKSPAKDNFKIVG